MGSLEGRLEVLLLQSGAAAPADSADGGLQRRLRDELSESPLLAAAVRALVDLHDASGAEDTARLLGRVRELEKGECRLQSAKEHLENQVLVLEQDVHLANGRRDHAAAEHRRDRHRWSLAKDELEKRCLRLETRDAAYTAKLRRHELAYEKLQKQLTKLVAQTNGRSGRSLQLQVKRPAARKRPERGASRGAADLQRSTESAMEQRLSALLSEQALLRGTVVDLRQQLERSLRAGGACTAALARRVRRGGGGEERDALSAAVSFFGGGEEALCAEETVSESALRGMPASWVAAQVGRGPLSEALCAMERRARALEKEAEGLSLEDAVRDAMENAENAEDAEEPPAPARDAAALLQEARALIKAQEKVIADFILSDATPKTPLRDLSWQQEELDSLREAKVQLGDAQRKLRKGQRLLAQDAHALAEQHHRDGVAALEGAAAGCENTPPPPGQIGSPLFVSVPATPETRRLLESAGIFAAEEPR